MIHVPVPYDSDELASAAKHSSSAAASPFVVAIQLAGIQTLPGISNGCILVFVFSASISDLHISSRTLYGLSRDDKAPSFPAKTDKRDILVPALALEAKRLATGKGFSRLYCRNLSWLF